MKNTMNNAMNNAMNKKTKVFMSGRSQHVTIPAAYRFRSSEVSIRRIEATGEIVLSEVPHDWHDVFTQLDQANVPNDFLSAAERDQRPPQILPALFEDDADEGVGSGEQIRRRA